MKEENDIKVAVSDMHHIDVQVRAIESINYDFDPEKLSSWSNKVVVYCANYRIINIDSNSIIPDNISINLKDEEQLKILVGQRRQLIEDYYVHAVSIDGFDKPFKVILQRCALLINLAKCWEDLGYRVHALISRTIDKDTADDKLKYIFREYIIDYYNKSFAALVLLGRDLPEDISDKDKLSWARMLIYTINKLIATTTLYDGYNTVESLKDFIKNEPSDLLIRHGFKDWIEDYKVEQRQEPSSSSSGVSIGGAKELLLSNFNMLYNFARPADIDVTTIVKRKDSNEATNKLLEHDSGGSDAAKDRKKSDLKPGKSKFM